MKPIVTILFIVAYWFFSIIQAIVLFLLPSKKIREIYSHLDAKEEEKRIQSIQPFVSAGDVVLDIGAGSGRFGKALQDRLKVQVSGVDVCDYSDHTIPFFVYDGTKLPFPDKSFDVVFFAFVLHHTKNQSIIMKEACRVARKQIVVFEDTYDCWHERLFTCWNDYHTNIFQGWIKYWKKYFKSSPSKMPMPLTFRSIKGWLNFFKTFPVEITSQEIRKTGYKPLTKATFGLKIK